MLRVLISDGPLKFSKLHFILHSQVFDDVLDLVLLGDSHVLDVQGLLFDHEVLGPNLKAHPLRRFLDQVGAVFKSLLESQMDSLLEFFRQPTPVSILDRSIEVAGWEGLQKGRPDLWGVGLDD